MPRKKEGLAGYPPGAPLMQVQKQAAEHQLSLRDLISSENKQEAQPITSADSADWKVEANDAAFRVIASIPMKWQALGR